MTLFAQFKVHQKDFILDAKLEVPSRGITALYGPSGSGKTTLLRAIAGLDRHVHGHLKIADTVWQAEDLFVPPHKRQIGFVFQEASLFDHLNVQKNIEFGHKRVPAAEQTSDPQKIIELLRLGSLLTRTPQSLSGGERQRVAIARALASSPKLLLMDEPLSGLDAERRKELLPFIESLHRTLDIPVIYVSHYANEVARLADHLVLLEHGKVAAHGPIDNMLTRLDLPLARDQKAAALIEATVAKHDDQYHLTYLDFSAGKITVERKNLEIGTTVRVRLAARDVSLTLHPQTDTSVLNSFAAEVLELSDDGPSQVLVRLRANDDVLLARITRKSCHALKLDKGAAVYVHAKSVAVLS